MGKQYVLKVGNGLTQDEVVEKCNKEAAFLIGQFIMGEEEMTFKWENTFIYKWMKDNHKVRTSSDLLKVAQVLTPFRSSGSRQPKLWAPQTRLRSTRRFPFYRAGRVGMVRQAAAVKVFQIAVSLVTSNEVGHRDPTRRSSTQQISRRPTLIPIRPRNL